MTSNRLLHGLDADQVRAVTTDAAPLAIIASAGSGKTTVLTRRIAHRIDAGTADAKHVLALTFTRDAAAELRRRLWRLGIHERIEAGTFHSVALRQLRDRALTRHEPPPKVANDRIRLIRECITELRLGVDAFPAMADIDWARARLISPEGFDSATRSERRRTAVPAARYGDLVAAYERLKRRRGVLDFDDLLAGVLDAVRTDSVFADITRWRFRHLFVDEAQDLNPLQHAVLEAWRGGRRDLCMVGDPRQAIYGWNGADHTTLTQVEVRYPGVTVVSLANNYRCSPQVVRAGAAALAASGQADDTVSLQPDGPAIGFTEYPTAMAEAAGIAAFVRAELQHRAGAEIAVLARTNEQLIDLERALVALGIATERSAGRSSIESALNEAYRTPDRERLGAVAEEWVVDSEAARRRVAEELDRYLTSNETGTFKAWVEARSPFDDFEDPDAAEAVALLTFHSSKGREWHTVVLAGAEEGLIPHSSSLSAAQRDEEARLFYVAITRAAQRLMITHSANRKGSAVRRSAWLDAVESTSAADEPIPPPMLIASASDPLAALRAWRHGIARVSGIDDVEVCSDKVLRSLHDDPPTSTRDLAKRLGISESAAARLRQLPSD